MKLKADQLVVIAGVAATALAMYYLYNKADKAREAIAQPVGNWLADIVSLFNGNFNVQAINAGVALTDATIEQDNKGYYMSESRKQTWLNVHVNNAKILEAILDDGNYVKPYYYGYINTKIITLADIGS